VDAETKTPVQSDETIHADVKKIFDEWINPALQSHGGFANLVRVEDRKVYVELGGGCRGCPGARMTMKQGIEAAIRERVPAVEAVIDATDHAAV
jgi:Fe-S cluster biogenesis protein NfuA